MNMDPKHWILNIIEHLEKQQDCKFILILKPGGNPKFGSGSARM